MAGFTVAELSPVLNWELRSIEAEYDSPSGIYKSAWELTDACHVKLSVSIPFGCTAKLRLPMAKEDIYNDSQNPMFMDVRNGICNLAAGDYCISYETSQSLKKNYSTYTPVREILLNHELREGLMPIFSLNRIPNQYLFYSLREIAGKFGGHLDAGKLDSIDEMIQNLINK